MESGNGTAEAGLRRRKSPKGDARREQILEAAVAMFSRDGYQKTAIAGIAEEVGLSLPGLLHYFPSKVDLLLALLERRDQEGLALLSGDRPDWRDVLAMLRKLNRRNARQAEAIRAFTMLNAESLAQDHPAKPWFYRRVHQVRSMIAGALVDGIASGALRADTDPDAIAAEIIGIMDGLQTLWLRDPESFDIVRPFEDFCDRLIRSIEASPGTAAPGVKAVADVPGTR